MSPDPTRPTCLDDRVKAIVSEALDVPIGQVLNHSSLIDDLGAESIDFLDIVFRLESAFGIKISDDDIWKGSFDSTSTTLEEGVATLKARMPAFRWDRLPSPITKADLPHLITVQTILDYLERRAPGAGGLA
jgi:acyl carrier protein